MVPPYPPGSIIRLSNDLYATVIDLRLKDPCRPLVQLLPAARQELQSDNIEPRPKIDLRSQDKDLQIVEYNGQDVQRPNFLAPPVVEDACAATMFS